MREVNIVVVNFADHAEGVVDHREVTEAEEVHLEQAEFFNLGHGELGGDGTFGGDFKGEELFQGIRGDHDAAGVDTVVADGAFQAAGEV